ncbi:MAG: hypothetical protein FJ026_00865 [Chloroflexi bacterium]|nr:hypothetical protein [Chloroflexota bacterium]
MKWRVFVCALGALALLVAGCETSSLPPTATAPPQTATSLPTASPWPSATAYLSPTNPALPQLVAEVPLRPLPGIGHNPQAVAVLDGRVYVANRQTDNVSLIEGDRVVAVIAVGRNPSAIAADSKTGLVYVANEGDSSISILSGTRVVKTVPAPQDVACLAALDGRLYTGGRGENALAVFDGTSGERVATLPLRSSMGILALAANSGNYLLYASVYDAVEIVDMQKLAVVGRVEHPTYVTLGTDPLSGRLFLNEYDAQSGIQYLVAYAAWGQQELGRVAVGGDPRGMDVDAETGLVYVANSWSNDVSVIDGRAMKWLANVPVGLQPVAVAVGTGGQAYVVNSGSDNVARLDGQSRRLLGVVPLALLPREMAVHVPTGRLYVASASSNSVLVLADGKVVEELPSGLHPTEVVLSPAGDTLYVLNYVGGNLDVISTSDRETVRTVDMGRLPQGLAIVPDAGQLYASDVVLDQESYLLLRRTELLTPYRVKVAPTVIQVDPAAGRAYMIASNGIPGSNAGLVLYVLDLKTGQQLQANVGGLSMTGLALDVEGQRIFSTAGRFGSFQLIVDDAHSLKQVTALALPAYPAALAYNPATKHVFVCLLDTSDMTRGSAVELWILDSRGFGTVARIPVSQEKGLVHLDSYRLVVDSRRGYVYLANAQRGSVHVLRDVVLPPPPTPRPTETPTPWPTLTPAPTPTAVVAALEPCEWAASARFEALWSDDASLHVALGCPVGGPQSGPMAEQSFERGTMLWRSADHTVLVLYSDGIWRSFADHWSEGLPELSCAVSPPLGQQQPKRGFGLVWCVEPGVKEGLGWASEDEVGYAGEWQAFEHGHMLSSRAGDAVYVLFETGIWRKG